MSDVRSMECPPELLSRIKMLGNNGLFEAKLSRDLLEWIEPPPPIGESDE